MLPITERDHDDKERLSLTETLKAITIPGDN